MAASGQIGYAPLLQSGVLADAAFSSENPQVSNSSDSRRTFQDEIRDVLGKQRTWDVGRHVANELRGDLGDKFIGLALQAVFVTDAVVHGLEQGRGGW
jgi:hypothetical protein